MSRDDIWPALPFGAWKDTAATLHMWTQIVGKIRLALTPWINHSWHVTLYVTSRGLTTSPVWSGERVLQIDFDFIAHQLRLTTNQGTEKIIALEPQSVATFYKRVAAATRELGFDVAINTTPNEIANGIPFEHDETHRSYDREYANRFWRVLLQADRVFKIFRADFCGKCSPVHFFWGSFDLAVTRFSGRPAPQHPGGIPHLPDAVTREAYSHEVSSLGFWPGNEMSPTPVFYSYAYPEPEGFRNAPIKPAETFYHAQMKEWMLPYDAVSTSADPDATLLDFANTTYVAAATRGGWDVEGLREVKPQLRGAARHS